MFSRLMPATLFLLLLTTGSAFAHVGLGQVETFQTGFLHPLSGIDHVLAMVAVGLYAASLGGVLSVLTRAELSISYVSEGQRVPEDLRPARALELVSSAVQLAKTSGAAANRHARGA